MSSLDDLPDDLRLMEWAAAQMAAQEAGGQGGSADAAVHPADSGDAPQSFLEMAAELDAERRRRVEAGTATEAEAEAETGTGDKFIGGLLKKMFGKSGVGVDKCVACIDILETMMFKLEPLSPAKRKPYVRTGQVYKGNYSYPLGRVWKSDQENMQEKMMEMLKAVLAKQAARAKKKGAGGSGGGSGSGEAAFLEIGDLHTLMSSPVFTGYPAMPHDFYAANHPDRHSDPAAKRTLRRETTAAAVAATTDAGRARFAHSHAHAGSGSDGPGPLLDALRDGGLAREDLFGPGISERGVNGRMVSPFSAMEQGAPKPSPKPNSASKPPSAAVTSTSGTDGIGAGGDVPGFNLTTLADAADPTKVLGNLTTKCPIYSTAHIGGSGSGSTKGKSTSGGGGGGGGGAMGLLKKVGAKLFGRFKDMGGDEAAVVSLLQLDESAKETAHISRTLTAAGAKGKQHFIGAAMGMLTGNYFPLPHICRPGRRLCRQRMRQDPRWDLLRRNRRQEMYARTTKALFSFAAVLDDICAPPDLNAGPTAEEKAQPAYPDMPHFSRSRFHGHLDDRDAYVTKKTPYGDRVAVGAFRDFHIARVYRPFCVSIRTQLRAVVDRYLHGYDVEEICTQIKMCSGPRLHTFAPSLPTDPMTRMTSGFAS